MDKITDLNDVQTFVIASRTGSLSAAALELGKPTSTVSRALTRLEKDLGVLLMRRGSRGLTLTDDGEGYLSACKRAIRSLHEGGLGLKVRQSNPSGLLKIACPVTFNKGDRRTVSALQSHDPRLAPILRAVLPHGAPLDRAPTGPRAGPLGQA